MRLYQIEVTRQAGHSPWGHYFPHETRVMKNDAGPLLFHSFDEAEAVAQHYREQGRGFCSKTYRVVHAIDPT